MRRSLDTDATIRSLTPGSKQYYCMSDKPSERGFGLIVYPSGARTFVYRYKVDGQQRLFLLGDYPATTLKAARELYFLEASKVKALRRGSKDGADPAQEKALKREARLIEDHERKKTPTVEELVRDYITRHASLKKRNWKEDERVLNKEVVSRWGKVKANKLTRADIIRMVDEIGVNTPAAAAQVLKYTRKMFNFSIEKAILDSNPCIGVKAEPDKKRERALSEKEIVVFWKKLESLPLSGEVQRALKLILITAQRPGEVIGMHTREIEQEWSGKWFWTIPAVRSKNKRAHRVPLTKTALELIGPLQVEDAETGEVKPKGYIFPCPHKNKDKSIEAHAVAVAVRRCFNWPLRDRKGKKLFGADGKPATENLFEMDVFRPHDLRRTANTLLTKNKVLFEHRERVLNHTLGKLDEIYNQHDFDDEKQAALETLERSVLSIVHGKKNNVVQIDAGRKVA